MTDETQVEREAAAFRALMNNPEVGLAAKKLYKKAVPTSRFPELEQEERLAEVTKPLTQKIEELEQAAMNERVERNRKENHAKCKDAGVDPAAIEKVMTEEKILNYDTAIKYVKAQQTNSQPSHINRDNTPIGLPTEAKEIAKDPKGWARKAAAAAMDEIIAARRQA